MSGNKKISTLIIWLLIVFVLIAGLIFLKYPSLIKLDLTTQETDFESEFASATYENTEFSSSIGTKEVSSTRTIVTDRFVNKLEKEGNIVILSKDGSIYDVQKGRVLVAGMIVRVDDESYDVYNIDSPVKSISSE